jgi:hypothetical protein
MPVILYNGLGPETQLHHIKIELRRILCKNDKHNKPRHQCLVWWASVYMVTTPWCNDSEFLYHPNNYEQFKEETVPQSQWKISHEYLWQSVGLLEHLVAYFSMKIMRMIQSFTWGLLKRNGRLRCHCLYWSWKLQGQTFQTCHSFFTHHRNIIYSLQDL